MNTPPGEAILGFDFREPPSNYSHLWDAQRRSRFLLKEGVANPVSTDAMVWPSVFDTGQGIGMSAEERRRLGLDGVALPGWIGPNVGLWSSQAAMCQALEHHALDPASYILLAATWLSDQAFGDAGSVGPYLEPTAPPTLGHEPRLLGFDVADGSMTSGLSNCGYSGAERASLARRWTPALNDNHLFIRAEEAFAFRDLTNRRVVEHAPFFVYGLYVVERAASLD